MKNITSHPITTGIGIIIALFTLAGLWFNKIEGLPLVALLFAVSISLMLGKDDIINKLLSK